MSRNKLLILVATLIMIAIPLISQVSNYWLPVWVGNHYQFVRLGTGLSVIGDTLGVSLPPVISSRRTYGQKLLLDNTVGGYRLPTGAKNITVLHNGVRNFENIDYTVDSNGVLKMLFANSEADIRVDFDSDITLAR